MKDPGFDPFGEHRPRGKRRVLRVAGSWITFESEEAGLLELAEHAYGGLGAKARAPARTALHVRLVSVPDDSPLRGRDPGVPRAAAFDGMIFCSVDAANFVLVDPRRRAAWVTLSPAMLRHRYHARYELLEFAVSVLLTRVHGTVPLHAACVGTDRSCVLLLGDSGAGKSTACASALLEGLHFVSEDSVIVDRRRAASGVPSFLHLTTAAARWVRGTALETALTRSEVIRRRSGIRKHEMDLRGQGLRLASGPLAIAAVVVLSASHRRDGELLQPLASVTLHRVLQAGQPYARGQPQWRAILSRLLGLPAFTLYRGARPRDTAQALRTLLLRRGDKPEARRLRRGVATRRGPRRVR